MALIIVPIPADASTVCKGCGRVIMAAHADLDGNCCFCSSANHVNGSDAAAEVETGETTEEVWVDLGRPLDTWTEKS